MYRWECVIQPVWKIKDENWIIIIIFIFIIIIAPFC